VASGKRIKGREILPHNCGIVPALVREKKGLKRFRKRKKAEKTVIRVKKRDQPAGSGDLREMASQTLSPWSHKEKKKKTAYGDKQNKDRQP